MHNACRAVVESGYAAQSAALLRGYVSDDTHPEQIAIKRQRTLNVFHADRYMTYN